MRVFFHWLFGLAVLVGMGVIGYQNPALGVALLFGGAAGWLATQKGATATIRRYLSMKGFRGVQKARHREAKDQFSKLNKAEHEAIRLIILHGSILPAKVRDYLSVEGFANPETVIDSIRAKTSFLQGSSSGEFSVNPSMKDFLEELVEEPLLARPVIGYIGIALMLVAVLGCGYLFYTRVYPGKPRPSLIATTQPTKLAPLPIEVKPSDANPKETKHDHPEQRYKRKRDNSTFSGNVTQGLGSISQVGGTGNTATVTNNFLPPSRSINSQDRNDLVTGLSKKRAKAVVLFPISDNEAANFAQQIYDVLSDAGWELPDKMVRPVILQGKFPPGVRIGFHGIEQPDNREVEIPDETIEGAVISMFLKAGIKNIYVNTRPQIAEGTIEFIVASNPESSPKPAEPKKPKAVPPASSTATPNDLRGSVGGSITQGPCSNLQVGGSNNQAIGGVCAPPPAKISRWDQKPAQWEENGILVPETELNLSTDHSMEVPAFVVKCDRPCWIRDAAVFGQYNKVDYLTTNDPARTGVVFLSPRPLGSGVEVSCRIRSKDGSIAAIVAVDVVPPSQLPEKDK